MASERDAGIGDGVRALRPMSSRGDELHQENSGRSDPLVQT